jgi:ribosome-associated protein
MSAAEPAGVVLPVDDLPPVVVAACRGAAAKQGRDTLVLAVGEVLSIAEHFVITSAPNDRQVKAIAEEVVRSVADAVGSKPLRSEGLDSLRWVLLDYGDLVVHVFLDDDRSFYELERLWADVPRLRWSSVEQAEAIAEGRASPEG